MQKQGGIAAITWAPVQRHAEDYAVRLNACIYHVHYLLHRRPILAPFKYVLQSFKTWFVLFRQRPTAVYVFISPVFAALSVYMYCRIANVPFIMDVGGQAIISKGWSWTIPLLRALARKARVNIVNHEDFKRLFASWGVDALVLERPPVAVIFDPFDLPHEDGRFTVTLISSFSSDEPIELVLRVARQLPEINFVIVGDKTLARWGLLAKAPGNVKFTGFLSGNDYWKQLGTSHAIMALTTDKLSLLSGAIEGMALGKPLILSDQPTLTRYFTRGAVFVNHSVESIINALRIVREEESTLARQSAELALQKQGRWRNEFDRIWAMIGVKP